MMMMMMMMMRDVLCNRTFLFFSTDRRKPLSLSLSSEFFSCVFSSQTAEEFKQKKTKKTSPARMQKRNLEVPPHKNNLWIKKKKDDVLSQIIIC
jgi:hypothetical protein